MKIVNITDLCDIQVGKTPSRNNSSFWGQGALWLSIADMKQGEDLLVTKETITERAVNETKIKIVPKNTVLYSFKLSIGKVGITKIPMYTNEAIAAFIIKDTSKLDTKFLYYVLKGTDHSIGSKRAVMGKTLNKEMLKKFNIPLPPLEDQKHIVSRLDAANTLRQKRNQSIALLDDYLKSVFLEMFGDPVENSKGWGTAKLKDLCVKITDGTHFSPPLVENGIPYITAKHIKNTGLQFFDKPTYISEKEHNKIYSRCRPEKGDVLYIKDGATTGIAAINNYDFEFSMLSSLALLKPDKLKVNAYFLCGWLNNDQVKASLIRGMSGVAIKRFTLAKINNFLVNVPPIEMQNKFADIVNKTTQLGETMKSQSEELEISFAALIQGVFDSKKV